MGSLFLWRTHSFLHYVMKALGISEGIEKLVHYCKSGKLKLSDGLPYIDDTLYVPKPMTTVETKEEGTQK